MLVGDFARKNAFNVVKPPEAIYSRHSEKPARDSCEWTPATLENRGPSPLNRWWDEVDVVHDLLQTPWGVRVSGRGREVGVVGTPRETLCTT